MTPADLQRLGAQVMEATSASSDETLASLTWELYGALGTAQADADRLAALLHANTSTDRKGPLLCLPSSLPA
jgi:hypothetical protein